MNLYCFHNSIYRQKHNWLVKNRKEEKKVKYKLENFFFHHLLLLCQQVDKIFCLFEEPYGSRFLSQQCGSYFQYLIEPIKYPISLNKLGTSIPVGSLNFTSVV